MLTRYWPGTYAMGIVLLFLCALLVPGALHARSDLIVPPGGAILLSLPETVAEGATIREVSRKPDVGNTWLLEGRREIVFEAPTKVDKAHKVTIAYTLTDESRPHIFEVNVDPAYSALVDSLTTTALEWLFLLLILALFIESAVLVLVALIRAGVRFTFGPAALNENGYKPSLYKSVIALALSLVAVFGFGLDPLSDIVKALSPERGYDFGVEIHAFADIFITSLLLAGGAESVRRVAAGVVKWTNVPTAQMFEQEASRADISPEMRRNTDTQG